MTFEEARKKLEVISRNKHRTMTFSITDYENGTSESTVTIIIIPGYPKKPICAHNSKSWSDALDIVRAEINSRITSDQGLTEAPITDEVAG